MTPSELIAPSDRSRPGDEDRLRHRDPYSGGRERRGCPKGGHAASPLEEQLRDLRRRRERLLDLAEVEDLAHDLAARLRSLSARIVHTETDLATARTLRDDALDLRATLAGMADIAREILGDADEGSLREFYTALQLRIDYDPTTRIASATVRPAGSDGGSVRVRGATPTVPPLAGAQSLTHSWSVRR
jgi:hypothetical protein